MVMYIGSPASHAGNSFSMIREYAITELLTLPTVVLYPGAMHPSNSSAVFDGWMRIPEKPFTFSMSGTTPPVAWAHFFSRNFSDTVSETLYLPFGMAVSPKTFTSLIRASSMLS